MRDELAEHFTTPVMINICTRDANLVPQLNRGVGLRVGPCDDEITVWLSRLSSERLLANIENNRQIALTAGDISTFRMRQLKGTVTRVADATDADVAAFSDQRVKTGALLGQMFGAGGEVMFKAMGASPMLAITFRLDGVFEQTPRPGTGGRLA